MGYEQVLGDIAEQKGQVSEARSKLKSERKKIIGEREKVLRARENIVSAIGRLKEERFKVKPGEQLIIAKQVKGLEKEKEKTVVGEKELGEAEKEIGKTEKEIGEAEKEIGKSEETIKKYQKEGYTVSGTLEKGLKFTKDVPRYVTQRVAIPPPPEDKVQPLIDAKRRQIRSAADMVNSLRNRKRDLDSQLGGIAPNSAQYRTLKAASDRHQRDMDFLNNKITQLNDTLKGLLSRSPTFQQSRVKVYESIVKRLDAPDVSPAQTMLLQKYAEFHKPSVENYLTASGITESAFKELGGFNISDFKENGIFVKGQKFDVDTHSFKDVTDYFKERGKSISRQTLIRDNPLDESFRGEVKLPGSLKDVISEEAFEDKYHDYTIMGKMSGEQFQDWWKGLLVEKEAEKPFVPKGILTAPPTVEPEPIGFGEKVEYETEKPSLETPIMTKLSSGQTATPGEVGWTFEGATQIETLGGLVPAKFDDIVLKQEQKLWEAVKPTGVISGQLVNLTGITAPFETAERRMHHIGDVTTETGVVKDLKLPELPSHIYFDMNPLDTEYWSVNADINELESNILGNINILDSNADKIRESPSDIWRMNVDDDPELEEVSSEEALAFIGKQKEEFNKDLAEVRRQYTMVTKIHNLGYGIKKLDKGSWEIFLPSTSELYNRIIKGSHRDIALGTTAAWSGMFGVGSLAAKIAGGDDWKKEEEHLQLKALETAYKIKRSDFTMGGSRIGVAFSEVVSSPTMQDIALIVGTYGAGKLLAAGKIVAGGKIAGWGAKAKPILGKGIVGKAVTFTAPKVIKYGAKPALYGTLIGYEAIEAEKALKQEGIGGAVRHVGRTGALVVSFGKGYKSGLKSFTYKPPAKPPKVKLPPLKQDIKAIGGRIKSYTWAYHPKAAGRFAVEYGYIKDIARRGYYPLKEGAILLKGEARVTGGAIGDAFRLGKMRAMVTAKELEYVFGAIKKPTGLDYKVAEELFRAKLYTVGKLQRIPQQLPKTTKTITKGYDIVKPKPDVKMAKQISMQQFKSGQLLADEFTFKQKLISGFGTVKGKVISPFKKDIVVEYKTPPDTGRRPYGKATALDYKFWSSEQLPSEYESFWMGKKPLLDVDLQLRSVGLGKKGKAILTSDAFLKGKPGVLKIQVKEQKFTRYLHRKVGIADRPSLQPTKKDISLKKGVPSKPEILKLDVKEQKFTRYLHRKVGIADRPTGEVREIYGRHAFEKTLKEDIPKKLIPTIDKGLVGKKYFMEGDRPTAKLRELYGRHAFDRTGDVTNIIKTTGKLKVGTPWKYFKPVKETKLPEVTTAADKTVTVSKVPTGTISRSLSKPISQYEWYQAPKTRINWDVEKIYVGRRRFGGGFAEAYGYTPTEDVFDEGAISGFWKGKAPVKPKHKVVTKRKFGLGGIIVGDIKQVGVGELGGVKMDFGEIGAVKPGIDKDVKYYRDTDVDVDRKAKFKLGLDTAMAVKLKQSQMLKLKLKLALASKIRTTTIATPIETYPPDRPTPDEPPPPKPTKIVPPVIPRLPKPGVLLREDFKPEKIVLAKPGQAIKEAQKPKILADPFLVQRTQVLFGVATHPKSSSKLIKKVIKTGWRLPTVEMMEMEKGVKKPKKEKFKWRLGKHVKATL